MCEEVSAEGLSQDRDVRGWASAFAELRPPLGDPEAVREAGRCLECGGPEAKAPCIVACPVGINIPGFIGAIGQGDPLAAAAEIFARNVLGGSCARVCPTEVLCEGACVLEQAGRRPVAIGPLQRYATDRAFASGALAPQPVQPRGDHLVAVIGAGPAGLACAAELAALGHQVTVYEARPAPGGLVRYAIAPYRQWDAPLPDEVARIAQLGVEFRFSRPVDGPARLEQIADAADAVFLGVGLGDDVDVAYPGSDLAGVHDSLPFIQAIKDGFPLPVGPRVAVLGGGNTAMDAAREALRLGAREVTVLYRRSRSEMPAFHHEVVEAEQEGVRFRWQTAAVRYLGTDRLEGVICQEVRLGEMDASGRRRPEAVIGSEWVFPVDTVVQAMGQRPRSELLSWVAGLALQAGRIAIDPGSGQTANPKYFAGGDAVNGGATVVRAVQEGKIAALGIHRYLKGLGR